MSSRRGKAKAKKNFWDREEMDVLMQDYKDMFIIDREERTIELKDGVTKMEADAKYGKFYKRHRQMAEAVMASNRSENRINGCISKLYEAMMFGWDPSRVDPNSDKKSNSYGYLYRTGYLYSLDWISGKVDGSCSFFSKKHSSIRRHKIQDADVPEGVEIKDHARFIAQEVLGWEGYTLARDNRNDCWDISYQDKYNPYTSLDSFQTPLQVQDMSASQSIGDIIDQLDWEILAQYIPDVPASPADRELAYVFLQCMEELVSDPDSITPRRAFSNIMYRKLTDKVDERITRQRVADVRHIVRCAYRYYREDYIEGDDLMVGNEHGVSFDF